MEYLVKGKGFNEDRVRAGAQRLAKSLKSAPQGRLDTFFTKMPKSAEAQKAENKRKVELQTEEKKRKKAKADALKKKR